MGSSLTHTEKEKKNYSFSVALRKISQRLSTVTHLNTDYSLNKYWGYLFKEKQTPPEMQHHPRP